MIDFQNDSGFFSKIHFYSDKQIAIEIVIVDFDRNVSDGSPDKVVLDRLV